MILLVHLLFGAAIGYILTTNPFLAVILAFLSHYFLDLFPHIEYGIESLEEKQWQKKLPAILKITLDFCLGVLFISLFSNPSTGSGQALIYVCAFFAILPDGFTVLNQIIPNKILKAHDKFHTEKIHFLNQKKISGVPISGSWRITTQVIFFILSIILFKI